MKKKTPKNSYKKKSKEKKEKAVVISTFLLFIAVVAFLFYYTRPSPDDAVAVVNGKSITKESLDWWYETSILPEYRDFVAKQDFLVLSLIPQEVLLQQAEKEGVKATEDEIEKFLGLYIIDNGLTLNEFEKHLNSRGISIDEIKKSFKIKAEITKLLEKENISLYGENELAFGSDGRTFQEYLAALINSSEIQLFPENINKPALKGFEATGDELCSKEKPVVRLYTASWCKTCNNTGAIFKNLIEKYAKDGSIEAFHWSLDTGDNLLTPKKENGVPEKEASLFKKYSPNSLVPTIVAGCKYKRVGSLGPDEEEELKAVLRNLAGG